MLNDYWFCGRLFYNLHNIYMSDQPTQTTQPTTESNKPTDKSGLYAMMAIGGLMVCALLFMFIMFMWSKTRS
jgi:hypothetical protein